MFLAILLLALVGAACGDDDATPGTTAAPGGQTDSGSNGDTPAPSATGGFLVLDGETIEFDSARCFLEEQEAAAGGGSILATGQGFGTDAEGVEVMIDFTRFSEESMFAGDDLSVTIGDPFSADAMSLFGSVDLGAVSIEGNTLRGDGFTLIGDGGVEHTASFELNC